jgi:hypothetical protein
MRAEGVKSRFCSVLFLSDLGDVLRDTGRSPVRPPFFARLSDAGLDAVAQYVVFELSEDCQHPCQGPPAGRGQIEGFAQRDEADIHRNHANIYVLPPAAQTCRRPKR